MSKPRESSWESRMARRGYSSVHQRINERAYGKSETPALDLAGLDEPPYRPSLEELVDEAVVEVGHFRIEGANTWVNVESLPRIIERIAATGYFAPRAWA